MIPLQGAYVLVKIYRKLCDTIVPSGSPPGSLWESDNSRRVLCMLVENDIWIYLR